MTSEIERAQEQTRKAYLLGSKEYDYLTNKFNTLVAYPFLIEILLDLLLDLEGTKILDVGCGSGRLMKLLESYGAESCGIDLVNQDSSSELSIIESSMLELPFTAETFDAVISYFSLPYLPQEAQKLALLEQYRVLKSNGVLCFALWYPDNPDIHNIQQKMNGVDFSLYPLARAEIYIILKAIGFRKIRILTPSCPPCGELELAEISKEKLTKKLAERYAHTPFALFVSAEK